METSGAEACSLMQVQHSFNAEATVWVWRTEANGMGPGAQVKNITRKHLNNPALVDLVGDAQSGKMPDGIKCARTLSLAS